MRPVKILHTAYQGNEQMKIKWGACSRGTFKLQEECIGGKHVLSNGIYSGPCSAGVGLDHELCAYPQRPV